jgi:four helix bundle protein
MYTNKLLDRLIINSGQIDNYLHDIRITERNKSIIDQVRRSSASMSLNYSEAIATRTDRDYANKARIALKEAVETTTGLRLLMAQLHDKSKEFEVLLNELNELTAMLHSCCKKAERKFT